MSEQDIQDTHCYGIIDPDYARIYTQARIIAWQYGYSLLMHGSFTRDLDLLMVPWEEHACNYDTNAIVERIAQATGLRIHHGDPVDKNHGRKSYILHFPDGDVRWVDFSVIPSRQKEKTT